MSNARTAYFDVVDAMKKLGDILGPALAVQFEASPGARTAGDEGVSNPTLSTVADPRRLALSEEIGATARDLRRAAALLAPHVAKLQRAVVRWEGQEGSSTR